MVSNPTPHDVMRKYNAIYALIMSFYSKAFYRDVARNWTGTGFAFLFFLAALLAVPAAFVIQVGIGNTLQKDVQGLVDQMPDMNIKEGILSTPNNKTYEIRDTDTQELIALISPTNATLAENGEEPKILVQRTEVIIRKNSYETRTYSFANIKDLHVDQKMAYKWLNMAVKWSGITLYPLIVLGLYISGILYALLLSILTLILSLIIRAHFTYLQCLRTTVLAMTPALLLKVIDIMGYIRIPGYVFFIIVVFYVILALIFNKGKHAKE